MPELSKNFMVSGNADTIFSFVKQHLQSIGLRLEAERRPVELVLQPPDIDFLLLVRFTPVGKLYIRITCTYLIKTVISSEVQRNLEKEMEDFQKIMQQLEAVLFRIGA